MPFNEKFINVSSDVYSMSEETSEDSSEREFGNHRLSKKMKIALMLIAIIAPASGLLAWFLINETGPNADITAMIEMRDGVKLATDIYLPDGEGPFPAILYRTPYGRQTDSVSSAEWLNDVGVAFVTQDHRGCYDSEGDYTAFGSDGLDANDTVEWMKTQSWFNGKFGTMGGSARGITQYRQIEEINEVRCQMIEVATSDLYSDGFFQGGGVRKMLVKNWLEGIGHGQYYYDHAFSHPYITDSWANNHRINGSEWLNVTWPSIHVGGWFDCFGQGIIDGFMGYQYKGGTGGRGNAKLVMGPWTHALRTHQAGDLIFPENAANEPCSDKYFESMFGEMLLDISSEYGDWRTMPNVSYYVMGDVDTTSDQWNRWATCDRWPVPHSNQSWYLQPDNSLSTTAPVSSKNFSFTFDPSDPLSTYGGANLMTTNRGSHPQDAVYEGRDDYIKFSYTVSGTPINVTGQMFANLYVTSNCTDTDFTVKICDTYPDGKSWLLNDGIVRMRYRDGMKSAEFMDGTGNTVYECMVDLWSTSYVFNTGHTIDVYISSSNYPRFDVNTNTGESIVDFETENPEYYTANNTIVVDPGYPSSIIMPVPNSEPNWN